jgi:23S rRNA (cytidine1920-2'-O)/16S rRNA (cytidine1409-2'-O)-methyltransferase
VTSKTPRGGKVRLDRLLVERGLAESRTRAEALILAGRVQVEGLERVKPGTALPLEVAVTVREPDYPWVSRGGLKLVAALDTFGLDPGGRVCLDLGASTGGFTDVLLARGAARVYAVDVGYGQLHSRLRADPRVVLRERVNARFLSDVEVPELAQLAVADLAFISLTLVLPALVGRLETDADVVLLVKPQFESERGEVGRGGIVRDPEVRRRALERVVGCASGLGLAMRGAMESPITGAEGNVELLAAFRWSGRRPNTATLSG